MPLDDVLWGYCRGCHREVETEGGLLIGHATYGRIACNGSGQKPSQPPPEGTWKAPRPSSWDDRYETRYAAQAAASTPPGWSPRAWLNRVLRGESR